MVNSLQGLFQGGQWAVRILHMDCTYYSAAVESTGQAKAEAQSRAEAAKIEGEAAVEQAKLKAEASKIEAVS